MFGKISFGNLRHQQKLYSNSWMVLCQLRTHIALPVDNFWNFTLIVNGGTILCNVSLQSDKNHPKLPLEQASGPTFLVLKLLTSGIGENTCKDKYWLEKNWWAHDHLAIFPSIQHVLFIVFIESPKLERLSKMRCSWHLHEVKAWISFSLLYLY